MGGAIGGRRPGRRAVRPGSRRRWVSETPAQRTKGYYRANGGVFMDFDRAKADVEATVELKRGWTISWHPEKADAFGNKRWLGLVLNSKGIVQTNISVAWVPPEKPKAAPKPKRYWGITQDVPGYRSNPRVMIATFDTEELAKEGLAARKALGVKKLEVVNTNRKLKNHVTADAIPASHNVVPIRPAATVVDETVEEVLAQGAQGKTSRRKTSK